MRVYKSKQISIPKDQNLTELLHTTAYPEIPESHLVYSDNLTNRSITLGKLRDRAGRIARGLKETLSPADQAHWAVIVPNSVDYAEIVHAILWTGGVVCPINHALKANEIGHGFAVSQPNFVIAYGPTVPAIQEAIDIAEQELKELGVDWVRPEVLTVVVKAPGYRHIGADFIPTTRLPVPHNKDTSKRLASIHLSSGTTGKPKGVELSHYNYVSNCYQLVAHDPSQFCPKIRMVAFTPWVHIGAFTVPLFVGPYAGMFHHAMPSYNIQTLGAIAGSIQATSFQGPPSVVLALANSDVTSKYDFSRARIINVGGAPWKQDLVDRLYSRAPWLLNQCFGMTEAAGYVAYQRLEDQLPAGKAGSFLPNIDARLVTEATGEDAPEGGPGELWIRGPNITRGYAFNEEANLKAFPEKGWYNTGDVCTIDKNGFVGVVGRTKDLIKYKGFQVSPIELESYINTHPDVAEGGVASVWDETQLTELPAAWVVLKEHIASEAEKRRSLQAIHMAVDGQVSGYKKLRGGVWDIAQLPKNPTGKILRKEMAAMRDGLCSLEQRVLARL